MSSPSEFGFAAAVVLVSGILGAVCSGRYEVGAAVAAHDGQGDSESAALANLALVLAVLTAIPIQFGTIAIVLSLPGSDSSWNWLSLLVLTGFGSSLQLLLDTRGAKYRVITLLTATRPLFFLAAAVTWSAVSSQPLTASSLCAAFAVAGLPATLRALWLVGRNAARFGWRWRLLQQTACTYSQYPRYQAPAAVLNNLSTSVFGLALGGLFGAAALGSYSLATRLTLLPATVLGGPINTVYLREAVHARPDVDKATRLYASALAAVAAIGLVALPFLVAITPVITRVLGLQWAGVGAFVAVTLPIMFAQLITAPPNSVLMAYSAQREIFWWRLTLVSIPFMCLFIAHAVGASAVMAVLFASVPLLIVTAVYAMKARGAISEDHRV